MMQKSSNRKQISTTIVNSAKTAKLCAKYALQSALTSQKIHQRRKTKEKRAMSQKMIHFPF